MAQISVAELIAVIEKRAKKDKQSEELAKAVTTILLWAIAYGVRKFVEHQRKNAS